MVLGAVIAAFNAHVQAQNSAEKPVQNLISEKTDDDQSDLEFSGELELGYSREYNFDLVDDVEFEYSLEAKLEVEADYEVKKDMSLFLKLEYAREMEGDNRGAGTDYTTSLTLDEAFLEISGLLDGWKWFDEATVTLGRLKVSESREWYYDATVDGLLFEAELIDSETEVTLSINREEWIGSDLLNHDETDTVTNLIIALDQSLTNGVDVSAYAISRNDSGPDNESPRFFGLSARGEILEENLKFWLDMASAGGSDDDKSIDGKGYDVGATFRLAGGNSPHITLGYAYGSGGGDTDTDFRQSGLHGNSDRSGGLTSYKYYGEVLDPELSNLWILTSGIGFRPADHVSIDLLYHRYAQDVALDELRDTSLDLDPNGSNTDIGTELDLIVGVDFSEQIQGELVIGYFRPGTAFDDADAAFMASAQISYEF